MCKETDLVLKALEKDDHGNVISSIGNFVYILHNDKNLENIVYNELSKSIDVIGELPWEYRSGGWNSCDLSSLLYYLESNYKLYSPIKCRDALGAYLISNRRYHPIKRYLENLTWDKEERIDTLLIDSLGAEDTEYTRMVIRKTLIAAVKRVMEPGVKFDTVLVLCGPQGIGKSTLFERLGKQWYSDSMTISDMKDKTAAEKLQGIWVMELGELAGLRKMDTEMIKSFLSRTNDRYRPTYGQYVESHLRSGIIVGTTNSKDGFLRDITGNRRFWTVFCNGDGKKKSWELTENDIDQLWAEAVYAYKNGESIYLNESMEQVAKRTQKYALESDPRQGLVETFLEEKKYKQICLMQIWCECLEKRRSDMKRSDALELEGILLKIGDWEPYSGNASGKLRFGEYGVQKAFVKKEEGASCVEDYTNISVEQLILS